MEAKEKMKNTSSVKSVMGSYENAQIQIGDEWFYITYEDIAKIIKKSKVKLKIEKKRVRSWATPVMTPVKR
jgi:hypothetical protein